MIDLTRRAERYHTPPPIRDAAGLSNMAAPRRPSNWFIADIVRPPGEERRPHRRPYYTVSRVRRTAAAERSTRCLLPLIKISAQAEARPPQPASYLAETGFSFFQEQEGLSPIETAAVLLPCCFCFAACAFSQKTVGYSQEVIN